VAEDLPDPVRRSDLERLALRADCSACVGLCCVAPAFSASADFAFDKPAGQPCPHLATDFRCGIHTELRQRGFAGCTVFDCFGAGQKVVRSFRTAHPTERDGANWRADPERAAQLFDAFTVMRQLHELLWYLAAARSHPAARSRWSQVQRLLDETELLSSGSPEDLVALDLAGHRARVADELRRVSEVVRVVPGPDLGGRDLIGADLRGADLRGADLREALFVTQLQVNAARGSSSTRLPAVVTRPSHWPAR